MKRRQCDGWGSAVSRGGPGRREKKNPKLGRNALKWGNPIGPIHSMGLHFPALPAAEGVTSGRGASCFLVLAPPLPVRERHFRRVTMEEIGVLCEKAQVGGTDFGVNLGVFGVIGVYGGGEVWGETLRWEMGGFWGGGGGVLGEMGPFGAK